MSEESGNNESASLEKLLIDNPLDFRFHAAYLTYSNIYDKTTDPEAKKQLNQNVMALQKNQIDYETFYRNISQYRAEGGSQYHYDRTFIKTQRKRDWRKDAQKQERNRRHRK